LSSVTDLVADLTSLGRGGQANPSLLHLVWWGVELCVISFDVTRSLPGSDFASCAHDGWKLSEVVIGWLWFSLTTVGPVIDSLSSTALFTQTPSAKTDSRGEKMGSLPHSLVKKKWVLQEHKDQLKR
jgi:hypothetical protein